ncbi:EAL domain-containing protein [Oleiphilus sp. HI0125]|nr:EAL domain-containing protein [Oleiphilus sp. HI0125]
MHIVVLSVKLSQKFTLASMPQLTMFERVAFYAAWLISAFVWLLHFEASASSSVSLISNVLLVLLAGFPLAVSFSQSGRFDAFTHIEPFIPVVISIVWSFGVFNSPNLSSDSVTVFVLLAFLNILLGRPYGLHLWLGISAPILVSMNYLMLTAEPSLSAATMTMANVLLIGMGIHLGVVDRGPQRRSSATKKANAQELAQLRYEKNRLNNALMNTEKALDQKIKQRTAELERANLQLNQQVELRKSVSDALVKSQTRLTQAIEASNLGLIDWEIAEGRYYQSNFHELFGDKELSSQEVIESLKRIVHPDDYQTLRDTLNDALQGNTVDYQVQFRVCEERDWHWMEESGRVVELDDDRHARRIMGTRRDIQHEVQRNEEVRLAKSVFDHTSEGVFVLDHQQRFLSVNTAYTKITGNELDTILGQALLDVSETPQATQVYKQVFETLHEKGQWQGELLERRRHGDYFSQWTQINVIRDERGGIKYYAGLISNMSDHKEVDEKLDYLLNYDSLTRLANRTQFQNQLHRALVRYQTDDLPFALVVLDIDRFKHVNNSFGYEASDRLLQLVAERLSNSIQRVDVLARIGGNEFACIVACSPTFQVRKFAERLFHSLTEKPYRLGEHELVLSCSVGIAMLPEHTNDIETLRRFGALAVQKAKYHGGNQIQMFDESLKTFSRERLEIEKELRSALMNDELEVHYQPKLDLKEGLILSYEALIRWRHPERGLVSPQEFVEIAEENGLISDLGAFVLYAACQQTKAWQDQGFGDLSVSVNLSPRQLLEPHLKSIIIESIAESGLDPQYLELELTESALKEDIQGVSERLSDLRDIGIKVSVDDFGTGYSSLSYLRHLPVDTLKIDREFITNIELSKEQQAITKAIVVLGSSLDLKVVAEGAENEAQLDLLRELGCDYVQGYYVSKPLGKEAMQVLLQQQSQ